MSKQIKKQNDAKQEMKIDSIKNDIISRKCSLKKHNFIQKYATAVFSKNYIADKGILKASIKLFTVNNDCNGCGTCRKVCPMKNIIGTDKPEYQNHCEFCLACIHLCPKNAIHLKNEKSGMRFINPHIKASEIINANRQI
jgi:ferredoxin